MSNATDSVEIAPPTHFPDLLTTSEVAELLRCSEKTIFRRVHAGKLPAIKEGGRYLFDADLIRTELMARMVRPKAKSSTTVAASEASDAGTANG